MSDNKIIYSKNLRSLSFDDLQEISEKENIIHNSSFKEELLNIIIIEYIKKGYQVLEEGVLDILNERYGFLRSNITNYLSSTHDVHVSANLIREFNLRKGDVILGEIRLPRVPTKPTYSNQKINNNQNSNQNNYQHIKTISIHRILEINKKKAEKRYRKNFDMLTAIYPNEKFNFESDKKNLISTRVVDIFSPIGKGQRALVVAPPRVGKTMFLQNICDILAENHSEVELIVVLIGERPEEVTDMRRSVKGEIISSTFDENSKQHIQIAEMAIEKAKRMVEDGKDVVVVLDSITRLARAYNTECPNSNKVLSGGLDANSVQMPKRIFGAARNTEEGGSLTIIGSALVDTGSRMDEVIFEEFKGTGNCEIVLDRKSAEKRIFPAYDMLKSGTRKEELLIDSVQLQKIWLIRKIINNMTSASESSEFIISKLKKHKTNKEFFSNLN